jgi:hypothetical protein
MDLARSFSMKLGTFVNRGVREVVIQKLSVLHEHERVADVGSIGVWMHIHRYQPRTG